VFRRILVAVDASETGHIAAHFGTELADQFDAAVRIVPFSGDMDRRRGEREVVRHKPNGGDLYGSGLTVNGVTRAARDHQLVSGIAKEAAGFGADLIVLGLDRRRTSRHHFSRSVREQLTRATMVPVMVSPMEIVNRERSELV